MSSLLKPKYIIATPSYNPESGGIMTLHQLCHLLNEISEAYVFPMPRGAIINHLNLTHVENVVKEEKFFSQNFHTSPDLNTPLFSGNVELDKAVAIYPEILFGNPFQFKNVARWILFHSGFHRKIICTSYGEVEFKFHKNYRGSVIDGFSEASDVLLQIFMPRKPEYQTLTNNVNKNYEDIHSNKKGTAYCVRKGKFYSHPLIKEDSICIDGKNSDQIREIMKKVKYFVSFDPYTYYSAMAVVYGCYSLVLPSLDLSKKEIIEWKKRFKKEPWLAFSEDELDRSWEKRFKLLEFFNASLQKSRQNVKDFDNFWTTRINNHKKV